MKQKIIKKLKQLFCNHKREIKEWWPLDKEGEKLFEDIGIYSKCLKCDKVQMIFPTIPKIRNKQQNNEESSNEFDTLKCADALIKRYIEKDRYSQSAKLMEESSNEK